MILCSLANGEKSVTENRGDAGHAPGRRLATAFAAPARGAGDGGDAEGKQIYYRLTDDRARLIIERVYELFCT